MSVPAARSRPLVVLPPLVSPVDQLWHVLLDLGEQLKVPWTIVGGQMVLLHALQHGTVPPQVSQDGDPIADLRADRGAIRAVVAALGAHGFALDGISPTGLAHRYVLAADPLPVKVDVLAPEGLGERSDLTTTRPGRTIEVPGGTQALRRSELIELEHEGRRGAVPRPSLLGAIVGKGAACGLPGDTSRHHRDLALLCALVSDPFEMREQMDRRDLKRVRVGGRLHDDLHPAWALLPEDLRAQGRTAYEVLTAEA